MYSRLGINVDVTVDLDTSSLYKFYHIKHIKHEIVTH